MFHVIRRVARYGGFAIHDGNQREQFQLFGISSPDHRDRLQHWRLEFVGFEWRERVRGGAYSPTG